MLLRCLCSYSKEERWKFPSSVLNKRDFWPPGGKLSHPATRTMGLPALCTQRDTPDSRTTCELGSLCWIAEFYGRWFTCFSKNVRFLCATGVHQKFYSLDVKIEFLETFLYSKASGSSLPYCMLWVCCVFGEDFTLHINAPTFQNWSCTDGVVTELLMVFMSKWEPYPYRCT